MSQTDRAKKKAQAKTSDGWSRDRMNETHRKGRRSAKKLTRRARRRLDQEESKS
jgi:hypothetical protein